MSKCLWCDRTCTGRFKTCCQACGVRKGSGVFPHDGDCEARLAASKKYAAASIAPARGDGKCKHGCGRKVAPGTTHLGNPFDVCCEGCAKKVGGPGVIHDRACEARAGSPTAGGAPPPPDKIEEIFDRLSGTTIAGDRSTVAVKGLLCQKKAGDAVPESHFQGKVVAFYFANCNGPCRLFAPDLVKFYNALMSKSANFEIVFVSCDGLEKDGRDYFKAHHGDWLIMDYFPGKKFAKKMGPFPALPSLIIVDAKGAAAVVGDAKADVSKTCDNPDEAMKVFDAWQKAAYTVKGGGKGISAGDVIEHSDFVEKEFPSLLVDFSSIDADGDGILTKEELVFFYHPKPSVEQKKTLEELKLIWRELLGDMAVDTEDKYALKLKDIAKTKAIIKLKVPDIIDKFIEVDMDLSTSIEWKEFCCHFGKVNLWLNAKLEMIVGLEGLKKQLRSFARSVQLDQKRRAEGQHITGEGSLVFIYRGSPGTGKTKMARLTATFLNKIGITKEDKLVEVQRDELCGGNPADDTTKVMEDAKGGVLFVDEAYRLTENGPGDAKGKEALETLMRGMTDQGNVFVLAGYRTEMNEFLKGNAGLTRRVTHTFDFDDYNCQELSHILWLYSKERGYSIEDKLLADKFKVLSNTISANTTEADRGKMNGGICEHIFRFAVDHLNDSVTKDMVAVDGYKVPVEFKELDIQFGCKKAGCNEYEGAHKESVKEWLREQLKLTVGLESLKHQIEAFQKEIENNQARRAAGFFVDGTKHLAMVFKGNPGSGKTRMARLMAALLERLGMTSSKKVVEVQREDLCGQHIGETAQKTKRQIEDARGGVLFIDEAYRLTGEGKDYGKEAMETIMRAMTEPGNTIIMAGYPREMDRLMQTNPGLERRITHIFSFDDFTTADLAEILDLQVKSKGFKIQEGVEIKRLIEEHTTTTDRKAQNGGICEHIARYAIQHLNSMADPKNPTIELTKAHIEFGCKKVTSSDFDGISKPTDVRAWLDGELNKIIGLRDLKNQLKLFQKQVAIDQLRRAAGHKVQANKSTVMVFQGNPGTGKTTIGRIMAQLLEQLGICQNHNLIEVQRDDLVDKYIGHTAIKTREVIKSAKGGVLFIDEAYRLSSGSGGGESGIVDFGKEAIETLMQAMTEEGMVMILAGYPKEMANFVQMNPGIQRRVTFTFNFDDYNVDDLAQILAFHVQGQGYEITPSLKGDPLAKIITENTKEPARKAMNGGICEHITRHAIYNLNERIFPPGATAPGTVVGGRTGKKGKYYSERSKAWHECVVVSDEPDGSVKITINGTPKTVAKEIVATHLRDLGPVPSPGDAPSPSVELIAADLKYGCQQVPNVAPAMPPVGRPEMAAALKMLRDQLKGAGHTPCQ